MGRRVTVIAPRPRDQSSRWLPCNPFVDPGLITIGRQGGMVVWRGLAEWGATDVERTGMAGHRIFATSFASIYPHYVAKAEKKGRTRAEVDQVIDWLTGYDQEGLATDERDMETFFGQAPRMNPNAALITGVICGYRVQDIEDPLMQQIRWLDKLVDELAKGKKMDSILR